MEDLQGWTATGQKLYLSGISDASVMFVFGGLRAVEVSVSASARAFLQKNRYSEARAKWYANHQHLERHPEEVPEYLREQAAKRGEHVRLDMETGGDGYSGGWVRGHSHPW